MTASFQNRMQGIQSMLTSFYRVMRIMTIHRMAFFCGTYGTEKLQVYRLLTVRIIQPLTRLLAYTLYLLGSRLFLLFFFGGKELDQLLLPLSKMLKCFLDSFETACLTYVNKYIQRITLKSIYVLFVP
jgi:hypothetical protein